MKHLLPRLMLLEELQVGERPAHILPDLRHRRALSSLGPTWLIYTQELRIEVQLILLLHSTKLCAIDPEVASFDSGSEPTICQQYLLHTLPDLLMHPEVVWLVPLANIPPVVFPDLHEREKRHEVEVRE